MEGTKVTVTRRVQSGTDGFNMPVYEEETETVEDCLVCPGATSDLDEGRPEGAQVAYTVDFPATYTESLKGCGLVIPAIDEDETFEVIGDPRPVPHNCPTRWNRVVEAGHVVG